jgi:NifU-like protein involved in Fe-S cluster formation
VVDHYEKPRNVGSFDKSDPNVGTGLVGAPACGDVMKLQIKARHTTAHPRAGTACTGCRQRNAHAWRRASP